MNQQMNKDFNSGSDFMSSDSILLPLLVDNYNGEIDSFSQTNILKAELSQSQGNKIFKNFLNMVNEIDTHSKIRSQQRYHMAWLFLICACSKCQEIDKTAFQNFVDRIRKKLKFHNQAHLFSLPQKKETKQEIYDCLQKNMRKIYYKIKYYSPNLQQKSVKNDICSMIQVQCNQLGKLTPQQIYHYKFGLLQQCTQNYNFNISKRSFYRCKVFISRSFDEYQQRQNQDNEENTDVKKLSAFFQNSNCLLILKIDMRIETLISFIQQFARLNNQSDHAIKNLIERYSERSSFQAKLFLQILVEECFFNNLDQNKLHILRQILNKMLIFNLVVSLHGDSFLDEFMLLDDTFKSRQEMQRISESQLAISLFKRTLAFPKILKNLFYRSIQKYQLNLDTSKLLERQLTFQNLYSLFQKQSQQQGVNFLIEYVIHYYNFLAQLVTLSLIEKNHFLKYLEKEVRYILGKLLTNFSQHFIWLIQTQINNVYGQQTFFQFKKDLYSNQTFTKCLQKVNKAKQRNTYQFGSGQQQELRQYLEIIKKTQGRNFKLENITILFDGIIEIAINKIFNEKTISSVWHKINLLYSNKEMYKQEQLMMLKNASQHTQQIHQQVSQNREFVKAIIKMLIEYNHVMRLILVLPFYSFKTKLSLQSQILLNKTSKQRSQIIEEFIINSEKYIQHRSQEIHLYDKNQIFDDKVKLDFKLKSINKIINLCSQLYEKTTKTHEQSTAQGTKLQELSEQHYQFSVIEKVKNSLFCQKSNSGQRLHMKNLTIFSISQNTLASIKKIIQQTEQQYKKINKSKFSNSFIRSKKSIKRLQDNII